MIGSHESALDQTVTVVGFVHTRGQTISDFAHHQAKPAGHTETGVHMAMPAWPSQR